MKAVTDFPIDVSDAGAYRRRFWRFAGPAPLLVPGIGALLWVVGEADMARAMWLYAALQGLILVGAWLRPEAVRLFAGLTLYSYILFSFAVVLSFGGILHSGGVVFVGMAGALFSLTFLGPRHFRILAGSFLFSVVLEVLLEPYLPAPARLGEPANRILFVIHLLVVSLVVFQTVAQYVRQNLAAKQRETERLKQLDSLKSNFFTRISHEFRTPLTVILGMADQIRRDPKQYARPGAVMIRESGTRLLNLVNQLLDLGKLEAGQMALHLVQGDIRPYLEYLVEPFRWLAEGEDVQLHLSIPSDTLMMDYDPEKMASLVTNLLSNALKHTPEGSDIQLEVERMERLPDPGPSTYCLFAGEEIATRHPFLKMSFRDAGTGIPRAHIPRIFKRYEQVVNASSRRQGGSGIGLAIVRELLALLGGQLYLDSQVGEGSSFTVFLPITHTAPLEEGARPSSLPIALKEMEQPDDRNRPPAGTKAARVLLVEDNPSVVAYLDTLLGRDYLLEVAADGEEGIARALEKIPDLIITDVMMPKQDGFAVCETLKKDIRTSHIPIIMLTARADTASKLQGLALGADDYLLKPFDPEELRVRVRNLLLMREKLRHRYQLDQASREGRRASRDLDDQFIDRINAVLQEHVDDEQLDTERLAQAMHMSRTQLFRKLKALTGHSASQLIRHFRMAKAKELVLRSDLQISEIAYAVGFKDPAYFSKVFTRSFGHAPTEFRQQGDVPS